MLVAQEKANKLSAEISYGELFDYEDPELEIFDAEIEEREDKIMQKYKDREENKLKKKSSDCSGWICGKTSVTQVSPTKVVPINRNYL